MRDFCRNFFLFVELYMFIHDFLANKKGVIRLRSAFFCRKWSTAVMKIPLLSLEVAASRFCPLVRSDLEKQINRKQQYANDND